VNSKGEKMHAQNWKAPFDEEVTRAKGRHQQAIADADDTFRKTVAEAERQRNADYIAARDWFDSVKSDPDHPDLAEARDAFDRAKEPASLAPARRALAQAIEKADRDFHTEVARIGARQGINTNSPHNPR
jgi:hypothetical protein